MHPHDRPTGHRHARRTTPRVALVTATALLLAACNVFAPSPPPTPSPEPVASEDPAVTYQRIEDQVIALRGLEPTSDVEPQLMTPDEVKVATAESFREDNPPELVEANERFLKAFSLLDEDASLADLYIELLGSQVAGFYSPDDKELYVISRTGRLGAVEKSTYSHEFTHALQDQTFGIEEMGLGDLGESDRSLARLALIEGDATLLMSLWQIEHLSPFEIVGLLGQALDPEQTEVLNRMPVALRDSLFFPYTGGLTFVQAIYTDGGWEAVNAAYDRPPLSTEQILHPEAYRADEQPIPVDLPDDLANRLGTGWETTLEDGIGEFQLQLWLRERGEPDVGTAASDGWGGDRVAILDGPGDAWAVVSRLAWDTPTDAAEFVAAATTAIDGGEHPGTVTTIGEEVLLVIASDVATRAAAVAAAAG